AAGREKEEAVMVGDRVYTDIASGVNAGVTTIGVLSGEASLEDYLSAEKPPTFIFKDIGEVLKLLQA
ncbi:MAG: HAD hydrolase-like protein, partial [Lachnospiraceae bacterium]|nr:HAD hydrolase-like protein [Lachnospiraceae bacterium]